jgi:hypothetical protein
MHAELCELADREMVACMMHACRQAHGDIRAYTLKWQRTNNKTCKDTGVPVPIISKTMKMWTISITICEKKIVVDFFSGIIGVCIYVYTGCMYVCVCKYMYG